MLSTEEIVRLTEGVEGFLTPEEAGWLYRAATRLRRGAIVEIGSWKGRSTICLARGVIDGGADTSVYAVDPHTGSAEHHEWYGAVSTFDEFRRNIDSAGVADVVRPLVLTSADAAAQLDMPIGFVFIDGAHDYESVRLDFEMWFPKLLDGGVVAFHDTMQWEGPRRLVAREVFRSTRFRDVGFVDSITYGTKVQCNSTIDRARNHGLWGLKAVYSRLQRLPLPPRAKSAGKSVAGLLQRTTRRKAPASHPEAPDA